MREKIGRYGILNVVLQPHPAEAYERLFRKAAKSKITVNYRAERYARISPLTDLKDDIFSGRLATWSEIDVEGNVIDKNTLDEQLFSEANIEIPNSVGFNAKVFNFSFKISSHQVFIELINDENEKIAISSAQRILWSILEKVLMPTEELDVHIVSKKSAIDYVLNIPLLKKIEIVVQLPNPDVTSGSKQEIFDVIDGMHAKSVTLGITSRNGGGALLLTPGVRTLAELSTENGHTTAYGRNVEGETVERSTKDVPAEIQIVLNHDETRAAATRRIARG